MLFCRPSCRCMMHKYMDSDDLRCTRVTSTTWSTEQHSIPATTWTELKESTNSRDVWSSLWCGTDPTCPSPSLSCCHRPVGSTTVQIQSLSYADPSTQNNSIVQFRRYLKNHLFGIWEITAQCDAWFSALYKYSYLLTYLHEYTSLLVV